MDLIARLKTEIKQEADKTRAYLQALPEDHWDWKPHPKSMSLQQLAGHIANLWAWLYHSLAQDELDLENPGFAPPKEPSKAAILAHFEQYQAKSQEQMEQTSAADLDIPWTLRQGEQVFFTQPRYEIIRTFSLNHLCHHRGQLSVYFRQLGVNLPPIFGPTADQQAF